MASNPRQYAVTDSGGSALDAHFSTEIVAGDIRVTYYAEHGKGNGGKGTNRQYTEGLSALLLALRTMRATVTAIFVAGTQIEKSIREGEATWDDARVDRARQDWPKDYPGPSLPVKLDGLSEDAVIRFAADLPKALRFPLSKAQDKRPRGDQRRTFRMVIEVDGVTSAEAFAQDLARGGVPARGRTMGQAYKVASGAVPDPREPFVFDPHELERTTEEHMRAQDRIAEALEELGATVFSPVGGGVDYDIAWMFRDQRFVAEVKATREANISKQLRLGLGQILEYRHQLSVDGSEPRAVLIAAGTVPEVHWYQICSRAGVDLVHYDDDAATKLKAILTDLAGVLTGTPST